ncbi:hypothetical protein LSCM1_03469 [Leishmania martiniquensis]|uniref:Uncharacterized protein n=1 Tax=Leishmania martiniquensis TaxID=1580590 RepID=A0A836KID8_9TRYP|nr:hypothetical protein LSCM1_03469 [Leishmania martiniquensis]
MASPSVLELSKQLLQLDSQAKALRNEVEYLRATKRSLEVSDATQAKISEMRESTGSSVQPKSQRSRVSAQRSSAADSAGTSLPRDFVDELTHKCSEVETSVQAHKLLVKEKECLQRALATAEDRAEEAEQQYISLVEVAGMDADGRLRSAIGAKKKNDYNVALRDAAEVYRQRENTRILLEGQSRELLRLAAILQETTDAENQRAEAVEVLAERKAKLSALRRECDVMARAAARRDKIADKNQHGMTSEDYIRHSNFDRRVALYELSKEDNLIKQNELAIRFRAMQIAKIQTHLELVGDAVIGDDMEEEERVDADIVEEMAKEIDQLYDSHIVANIRMDNIDCEIEKMEWRASALQHAKESTVVEMGRFRREHLHYLDEVQKTLDKERLTNGQMITRLQDEVDNLRRKSARKN